MTHQQQSDQARLNPDYQRTVVETAVAMYPDVDGVQYPLLIALPAGIHPYNRAIAYYDPEGNAIVLYQDLGRQALAGHLPMDTVQHELAHWYQFNVLGETGVGSTNVHRRASWQQSCYIATCNLWPELDMERWQFQPYTSKRVEGKVRRIQKAGALTDVELHHWPRSLSKRLDSESSGFVTN